MKTKEVLQKFFISHADKPLALSLIAAELDLTENELYTLIEELNKDNFMIKKLSNDVFEYSTVSSFSFPAIYYQLSEHVPDIQIQIEKEVTSTNDVLKENATLIHKTPFLLIAEQQTKGRGRFGRTFISSEGGVYMSLLIKVHKSFDELPQYTIITAAALALAIEKLFKHPIDIKWVNDLYYQNKKIAGILAESTVSPATQSIDTIIIGIGVNFQLASQDIPQELKNKIGGLFNTGTPTFTRNQLIVEFLNQFYRLLDEPEEVFLSEYRKRSFVIGKRVSFSKGQQSYSGIAVDINEKGELVVKLDNQEYLKLSSGEISLTNIS